MDVWQILLGGGGVVAVLGILGAGFKWLFDRKDLVSERHRKSNSQFRSGRAYYIRALEAEKPQIISVSDEVKNQPKPNPDDPYELRDRARQSFNAALQMGPDRKTKARILYQNVKMLYDEGIHKKETCDVCIEDLSDALKLFKGLEIAYLLRGQIYQDCGDKARALEDYERYGKLNPDDDETQSRIKYLEEELGIVDKPTIWQNWWQSITGRTALCTSLAW